MCEAAGKGKKGKRGKMGKEENGKNWNILVVIDVCEFEYFFF